MIRCQILKNVFTAIKEHTFLWEIYGHIKLYITVNTHTFAAGNVCKSIEKIIICKCVKEDTRK